MAKLRNRDLKKALVKASVKADQDDLLKDEDLIKANNQVYKLFGDDQDFIASDGNGVPKNVTFLTMFRVRRYMKRKGVEWKQMDSTSILNWLLENWVDVLKVIMSVLFIFI